MSSKQSYTVSSDRVRHCEKGDVVTADDLPAGTNIDALLQAGHLRRKTTPTPKPAKKKG